MDAEGGPAEGGPPKKEAARTAALLEASRAALRARYNDNCGLSGTLPADVVLAYLLRHCYADTARALLREASSHAAGAKAAAHFAQVACAAKDGGVFTRLEKRRAIRELVRDGRVAEAIAAADELLGGSIAAAQPVLHFDLCCQHYVELVRAEKFKDACDYSQAALAPLGQKRDDFMTVLKDFLALIAYTEPEKTMLKHLMGVDRRDRLAERLSGCLFERELEDLGGEEVWEDGSLERFVRQVKVVKGQLRQCSAVAAKSIDVFDVDLGDGGSDAEQRRQNGGDDEMRD